jgi:hypothetical protein
VLCKFFFSSLFIILLRIHFAPQARKRISDEAIEHLNAFYVTNKRPTDVEKDRLAVECNITLAQVNTWFNNARSRRGDTRIKLSQKTN